MLILKRLSIQYCWVQRLHNLQGLWHDQPKKQHKANSTSLLSNTVTKQLNLFILSCLRVKTENNWLMLHVKETKGLVADNFKFLDVLCFPT